MGYNPSNPITRGLTINGNTFTFTAASFNGSAVNNDLIPIRVYGIKDIVVDVVNPISEVVTFGSTGGQSVNINSGVVTKLEGNTTVDTQHTHYASGVLTAKIDFSCKLYTDGILSEKTYAVGDNIATTGSNINRVLII